MLLYSVHVNMDLYTVWRYILSTENA